MISETVKNNKAYQYALWCVDEDNKKAGKYVKKQCQEFLGCLNDENSKYYIDENELKVIEGFLRLINIMPKKSAYDNLVGFQWFFIINSLCVRRKSNGKRRYELSILLIARKNGKTLLTALILMLLMLLCEPYAETYSVAPDRELSGQVYKEFQKLIANSPSMGKYFKVLRSEIRCKINNCVYKNLACSDNRLDGRLATVWIGDEVGALRNSYPLEAMQSSQTTLDEKFGIIISTAYESLDNPMTENVNYAKKVLDKTVEDDTTFALIYEPDDVKQWQTDTSLYQANPLAIEVENVFDNISKKRKKAIEMPSTLTNFKTKHMNIFLDGNELEVYIPLDVLRKGLIEPNSYDWTNKEVYIGVDLAQSDDNTSVAMVTYDRDLEKYVVKSWVFYPVNKEEDKEKREKVPYSRYARMGLCYPCGGNIIDYKFVEEFVLNIEKKMGVKIVSITYDRYNAISSVQKWEDAGYEMIEQKQHSQYLHLGTKKLREIALEERILYEDNKLFEINIQNALLDRDTNMNMYINKKKSNGKIDMVDAVINCFCSIEADSVETTSVYEEREGFIFF